MKIRRKRFIIVTKDYGGFEQAECIICKQSGWIDDIVHLPACPVCSSDEYVEVLSVKERSLLDKGGH